MTTDWRAQLTFILAIVVPAVCVAAVFWLDRYQLQFEPVAPSWAIRAKDGIFALAAGSSVSAVFSARGKVAFGLIAVVSLLILGFLWAIASMSFARVWP